MKIHPLAVVSPQAQMGHDVTIGPFCVVEAGVEIGAGSRLESHAIVKQGTRLGERNHVFEHAVLGGLPQHLKRPELCGTLTIGSGNVIREHATVH
jgi:UDP-N-acetylglucosamine acyltransferase